MQPRFSTTAILEEIDIDKEGDVCICYMERVLCNLSKVERGCYLMFDIKPDKLNLKNFQLDKIRRAVSGADWHYFSDSGL